MSQPVIAQKSPIPVEVEAGKNYYRLFVAQLHQEAAGPTDQDRPDLCAKHDAGSQRFRNRAGDHHTRPQPRPGGGGRRRGDVQASAGLAGCRLRDRPGLSARTAGAVRRHFALHSPSGVAFEVKIACIRALDKDFLPQAAPAVAQTAGSGRIRPRSRCFLAQGRRFSAQRTDLSSRFRSV